LNLWTRRKRLMVEMMSKMMIKLKGKKVMGNMENNWTKANRMKKVY
jgi:hypothetical protein